MARQLWREQDFRWLFLSQAISTLGDRIVLVALVLLVARQTGSTADLALVLAAQGAAAVLFLVLGGVWADRLPRQRVMLATDLARGILHAALAVLILTDELTITQLVAIEFAYGTADAFFRPAFTGLVPQTVPHDLIQAATSANTLTQTAAGFAGPAIATALVIAVGPGAAFAVDAGTFFASAALLALVRPRDRVAEPRRRASVLSEARAGFLELRARPWVWVTVTVAAIFVLLAQGPYVVLGPTVAASSFGAATAWGWLAAAVGLGAALGAALGLRWRPRRPLKVGILCLVPFGAMLMLTALAAPFVLVLASAVIAGMGLALFAVFWETALAQRIPPEALSRVAAYDYLGSYGLLPFGLLAIGLLAEQFSAPTLMAAGGGIAMVAMLLALVPRAIRELPQPHRRVLDVPAQMPDELGVVAEVAA